MTVTSLLTQKRAVINTDQYYLHTVYLFIENTQSALCTDFSILSGIELDEDRRIDGDSDFTIRGRLISLVEKVAYLKKKMAILPKEKKDKKPSKSSAPEDVQM